MNSQNWQRVKEIFAAATELSGGERDDFLRSHCDTEDLRRRVEELLQSHDAAGVFLGKSAVEENAADLVEDAPDVLRRGQQFGRYEIERKIGAGGMGEVYLGRDTDLGREAALKVLPAALARDAERLRRFMQEAQAASALNHPNIVTIYEIGTADGWRFIAAEYVAGETLRERIEAGNLTIGEILEITIQVADALSAAHNAGIVHRDVKPENIVVRANGSVKVLDFGLAKFSPENEKLQKFARAQVATEPGLILGTVAYMSPEQMRGQRADAASDVWSLGVVLYEMLAGRTPFAGETESDRFAATLTGDVPPVSAFAEIPAALEKIIGKALQKDRQARYRNAGEFREDLIGLKRELVAANENLSSLKSATDSPATNGNRAATAQNKTRTNVRETGKKKSIARRPLLIFAAAAFIAALTAGAYFAFLNSSAPAAPTVSTKPKNPRGTDSDEAYQLYLTAMSFYRKSGLDESRAALDYLDRAVTIDPEFALAHAQMADVYYFLVNNSIVPPKEGNPKVRAAAERALAIDPTLTRAHVALGIAATNEYEWQKAEASFRRAQELAPDDYSAYIRHAELLSFTGRHDEAIAKIRRAVELNPLRMQTPAGEGAMLYNARRFDEAEAKLASVLHLQPDNAFAHAYLAYVFAARKEFDRAIAEYRKVEDQDGETTSTQIQIANLQARAGRRQAAIEGLKKVRARKDFVSPGELAMAYGNLGEREEAFRLLDEAVRTQDYYIQYLKVDPNFDALRGDARFQAILRRVGLE